MTDSKEEEVALLVDVENLSSKHLEDCYRLAAAEGRVSVRRVYGNHEAVLHGREDIVRLAFEPVILLATRKGKSSADIRLVMDAMDLLHQGQISTFAIASSDGDFAALARRLRASGCFVVGIGKKSIASDHLVQSCDRFHSLAEEGALTAPSDGVVQVVSKRVPDRIRKLAKDAWVLAAGEGEYVLCARLGQTMRKLDPSFNVRDHGFAGLRRLLEAMPRTFEVETAEGDARVRLRQDEAVTAAAARPGRS